MNQYIIRKYIPKVSDISKVFRRYTNLYPVLKKLSCMYTFTINGKTSWYEISRNQERILKCLDLPLPVEPKKVQAEPKAKGLLRTTCTNMGNYFLQSSTNSVQKMVFFPSLC